MLDGPLPTIAQIIAGTLAAAVVLLLAYVALRRLVVRWLLLRVQRRVERAMRVLQRHQEEQFASIDRLLFQLGELHDIEAVEIALGRVLEDAPTDHRPRLRQVYASLDVIERYIREVREGVRWRDRARAAGMLGQLEVAEAIPDLVKLMRDPHEDVRTVKLAAARALGQMEAREAVPLLVKELDDIDEWASPRIAEVLVAFGAVALPELLRVLGREEATNARVWAAQILGRIGDAAATTHLIALLRDRNNQVRLSAAEALGRLGSRQAVNALLQVATRDPAAPVRAEAARALGAIHDQKAIESLVLLLSDPDYWTRLRAIEAIELIGPTDPSCLQAALRDPVAEVRAHVAVALERIGVFDQGISDLQSANPRTRDRAHRLLVEMGRAGLMGSLLALLEHTDFRLRARIVAVLADVGDARATESLKPLVRDAEWPVRARAVEAVARLAPADCLDVVLPALSDDEETVRGAAVEAVKELDLPALASDENIVAPVLRLFENMNAVIRTSVVEAVGHARHEAVDAMLRRAVQDPNAAVRLRAVEAVAERRDATWLEPLEALLSDEEVPIRIAAVRGLQQIGSRRALQAVVSSLTTTNHAFREALSGFIATYGVSAVREFAGLEMTKESTLALVWALGKTGDVEALSELYRLAESDDPEIRASTVGALAKIRHERANGLLLELLGDCNERVRAAAVNALGRTGFTRGIERLLTLLDDPDRYVRDRVALSIGRIGGPRAKEGLDAVAERSRDPRARAHVAAGYALCGVGPGFDAALELMASSSVREELEALLRREPAELARRIRGNLRLEGGAADAPLGETELRRNYAAILRSNRHPVQRVAAIKALRALGVAPVTDLLLNAVVADPAPDVRRLALDALAPLVAEPSVQAAFQQALRDPNAGVQGAAAAGLARSGDPGHNLHLLHCLVSGEAELTDAVVRALVANNQTRVTAFMDELMGYDEPRILRGGARVLGELGDPRALGLLGVWLESADAALRAAATEALGAIGTFDAREMLSRTLADPSEDVRIAAVRALARLSGRDAVTALRDVCGDPSPDVRMALAGVVRSQRGLAALELAEALCADPDESIRATALLALLQVDEPEGTERFLARIATQSPAVARRIAASQDCPGVVATLVTAAAASPAPNARLAALRVLVYLGRPPAEVLVKAFGDPSSAVRLAAVEIARDVPDLSDDPALKDAMDRLLHDPDRAVRDAVRRASFAVIEAG